MNDSVQFVYVDLRNHRDLAQLAELDRDAFGNDGLTILNLSLLAMAGRVYALKNGENLVADAIVLPTCDPHLALLFSFAVSRHCRGKGLGRHLMERLLPELACKGWKRLQLTVDPANTPAVALYTKAFRFRQIDQIADCLGPGKHRLLLETTLPT